MVGIDSRNDGFPIAVRRGDDDDDDDEDADGDDKSSAGDSVADAKLLFFVVFVLLFISSNLRVNPLCLAVAAAVDDCAISFVCTLYPTAI